MKVIIITAPDGQYFLPLEKVAEHRARYYAQVEHFTFGSEAWKEEIEYCLNDKTEGINYLMCNSDFSEWRDAVKFNDLGSKKEDFWLDRSNFRITEI